MDLKAPDSGESARNRWENLPLLTARDEIKIVIAGPDCRNSKSPRPGFTSTG